MGYEVVSDAVRERKPKIRGKPYSQQSLDLLAGKTVFDTERKNFGSLYTLAKRNGLRCITQKQVINGKEGTVVYFLAQE